MKTCNIVFHTHWDREWYYTFEQFRFRLSQVMKRILDGLKSDDIDYFVLDGQVAALNDLLEVCDEELKEKLLLYVNEGRIIIGPWYVLADEFLVAGESLVRNLEIGIDEANYHGKVQRLGYLPDTFGHISQMPQILNNFDIDDALVWRGVNARFSVFIWQSPDKSSVFTAFLPKGYYMPIIDQDDYIEKMKNFLKDMEKYSVCEDVLLTNGGDHLMPSLVSLKKRAEELEKHTDYKYVFTNYEDYIKKVKSKVKYEDLERFEGELRDNNNAYILPNVLSTRTYLKVKNQYIEDYITGYVEPLLAIGHYKTKNYPQKYIKDTWKMLLLNHPHDSICGCSIDEVHNDMENRMEKLLQRLPLFEKMVFNDCEYLDNKVTVKTAEVGIFDDFSKFTVFNPHPYDFSGYIEGEIWIDLESQLNDDFIITDDDNKEYIPNIMEKRKGRIFESPLDGFPEFKDVWFYKISFYVENLKASSLKNFHLKEGKAKKASYFAYPYIENEKISVLLESDGTLSIFDKKRNLMYKKLNQFYSTLDRGDEYNYSPPLKDVLNFSSLLGNVSINKTDEVSYMKYDLIINLPKGLNNERTGASEDRVDTIIKIIVALNKYSDTLNIKAVVENNAMDQRLRVRLPLNTKVNSTLSDSAFDILKRDVLRDEEFYAKRQREVKVCVNPTYSMILAYKSDKGIAFYHRGLNEYQIAEGFNENLLDVTVIRSVGWLSRDDFSTRGGGAGPKIETFKSQCLGTYEFEYSIRLYDKDKNDAEYLTEARLFRIPPKIYKGYASGNSLLSFIKISNSALQWTSFRYVDKCYEIRIWNPLNEKQEFKLLSDYNFDNVNITNMAGRKLKEVKFNETISIEPKKIMTLRFK